MKEIFIIAANTIVLYFLLLPVVNWYHKAKKEMRDEEETR